MSDTIFTFDPDNSFQGFNSKVSLELAELTNQAYKQFDAFQSKEKTLWELQNYNLVKEFKDGDDPFGFVASRIAENDKTDIFIVFRGTRKLVEWFKDGNIPLVSYFEGKDQNGKILKVGNILGKFAAIFEKTDSPTPIPNAKDYGRVALGFRQIYTGLRTQIIDAVNECSNISRIFVTGHSLGAALATLAIPDILKNIEFANSENVILYTFASPRCGDNEFAVRFCGTEVKHWRIANTEDLVPMIPFPTGNVFHPPDPSNESPDPSSPKYDTLTLLNGEEYSLGTGGVAGVDKNPNPIFGFFKAIYDREKRRMPNYAHTGTPIYFTIHAPALEKLHSLEESYIPGISQV